MKQIKLSPPIESDISIHSKCIEVNSEMCDVDAADR